MDLRPTLLASLFSLLFPALALSVTIDGTVLSIERVTAALPSYREYVTGEQAWYAGERAGASRIGQELPSEEPLGSALLTAEEYGIRARHQGFVIERITYASDGLRVAGYIFRPEAITERRPAIIFNRGGNRDFGKLRPDKIVDLYPYLAAGFVVVGSQYRGSDGGDGNDEFGGADLDDVMNLFPLIRQLGYVDPNRVTMLGVSRGGMMTYLALSRGAPVRAAVVIGAPADEVAEAKRRPMEDLYRELVPGFDDDPLTAYRDRSALYWAERIRTPVLILHGSADWRVDPRVSIALSQRLDVLDQPHSLVVLDPDDHTLDLHRQERERMILSWFGSFLTRTPAGDVTSTLEHAPRGLALLTP
jgi:dipeptidyl aminopeptidase/acylaminoacyl peptidase